MIICVDQADYVLSVALERTILNQSPNEHSDNSHNHKHSYAECEPQTRAHQRRTLDKVCGRFTTVRNGE